jgi:iron(III) transport system permease protein
VSAAADIGPRPLFRSGPRLGLIHALAILAALVALAPLVAVVVTALGQGAGSLSGETFARYALTSLALAGSVAVGAGVLGATAAWLVVMHRFPGRDLFAWALVLPLAAPAFATAYGYADLFDVAGPVRQALHGLFGHDVPLDMRSLPGAAFVLSLAFYPYVYLTLRAALVNQSVGALEAARSLGRTARGAFWAVTLPMARPAVAAGMALAVMETLADYGASSFLGVQTLTTGVVRAWAVFGSTAEAARLALPLLGAAAVLLLIERMSRAHRSADVGPSRWRPLPTTECRGAGRLVAPLFCLLLIVFGLLLPAGWLAFRGLSVHPDTARLIHAGLNALTLAVAAAVFTTLLAAALALGAKKNRLLARVTSLGYATPGAVMAIGLLAPAGYLWRGVAGAAGGFGVSIALLLLAYAARLMAAALEPVDAGLERVTPSIIGAARSLGQSEAGAAFRVELPMASGALITAALLVFIDVLKELPATVILRPFGFDTLAVMADYYAKDERLADAAYPALMIVLVSIPAVIWLTRRVGASRPGAPL